MPSGLRTSARKAKKAVGKTLQSAKRGLNLSSGSEGEHEDCAGNGTGDTENGGKEERKIEVDRNRYPVRKRLAIGQIADVYVRPLRL